MGVLCWGSKNETYVGLVFWKILILPKFVGKWPWMGLKFKNFLKIYCFSSKVSKKDTLLILIFWCFCDPSWDSWRFKKGTLTSGTFSYPFMSEYSHWVFEEIRIFWFCINTSFKGVGPTFFRKLWFLSISIKTAVLHFWENWDFCVWYCH